LAQDWLVASATRQQPRAAFILTVLLSLFVTTIGHTSHVLDECMMFVGYPHENHQYFLTFQAFAGSLFA
jgi:hypothetical protein